MTKHSPRWGADIGLRDKIRPFQPKAGLAQHGLKGKMQDGRLTFSRALTRRQAKKDAADAIPASDAVTQDQWSEREQNIVEQAEDLRRGLGTWFSASGAEVRNYIQDQTPTELSSDALKEVIKSEEYELRHGEDDDFSLAEKQHKATIIELSEFQEKHGEQIGKRTPDIKKNVEQAIAILLFILIVEGCFNALLFKDAQSQGLLGGVLVAFGVSAVNVAIGVVAGFFGMRYLNHPQTPMKVMGGVILAIFVTMGVFLNFFVAHYRDAVEAGLHAADAGGSLAGFSMFDISPGAVIGSMFPNIFGLDTLIAIGLLFVGLAVFSVAVYEGYDRISDRYPGYGRVWRKERKAYEQRQFVRDSLRNDLSTYFTNCRTWFDVQQSRHVAAKREIEKAMTELETRRDEAMAIASRCADQERGLKIAYRQAHRRMRNSLRDKLGEQAEIPAYFDELVTPKLPVFDYAKERDQANEAILVIDHNIGALSETRTWLETHIQEAQKGLSSIDRAANELIELRAKQGRQKGGDQAMRA